MDKQWVAHVKNDEGRTYEVSVCYGDPDASWGWFGPEKIRMEMTRSFEDAIAKAQKIAAALNAAGYDPTEITSAPPPTCTHGYTICRPCKFPPSCTDTVA